MDSGKTKRLLLIPSPYYGHIIPLLEFGKKLSKFHQITFAVSSCRLPDLKKRGILSNEIPSNIKILPLEDGLSIEEGDKLGSPASFERLVVLINSAITDLLNSVLVPTDEGDKITSFDAVVSDYFLTITAELCHEKKVPFYFFNTAPVGFILLALTTEESSPSMPDVEGEEPFYEPTGPDSGDNPCVLAETMKALLLAVKQATPLACGVICNAVRELENETLTALLRLPKQNGLRYYCVGPLIPAEEIINGSQLKQQDSVLKWLDAQEENSVVYVSFGSLSFPEPDQVQEIGLSLLALEKPFIWSIPASQWVNLPDNLRKLYEETPEYSEKKFLLLPWARQKAILQHPSTRVFVSHCGWNSSIEALYMGVPVVAWPMFSDQKMNARWLVQKGVGLMLEGTGYNAQRVIPNAEITSVIRQVAGWDGKDGGQSYRRSVKTWQNVVRNSTKTDGSSYKELMEFAASF